MEAVAEEANPQQDASDPVMNEDAFMKSIFEVQRLDVQHPPAKQACFLPNETRIMIKK